MSDHALTFGACKLAEALMKRHSCRYDTAALIKWAKGCAEKHAAINTDPGWWIASAVSDIECLDACLAMLREAR